MAEPVILELAVNGATLRHRNRHVPRTPAEITEAALAGIESGASIVHNHSPYANPLADVEYMFARSGELGAAPSISVFEPGFLRTTLAWQRSGRLPPGAMVKLYFGGELEFGLRSTATALEAYLELLEPSGLPWSVAVLGGDVVGCGLAELAIRRGGHVRVGLEDYAGPGEPSNLDLLRAAVAVVASRSAGRLHQQTGDCHAADA
jgi:uncharacterized protein (DUF849 family)